MVIGAVIFEAIGYDGPRAVKEIFFTPILASYKWPDVARRAAPLILIALGLCMGNRAKVWNIGAEGQYIVGALAGAGVAYFTENLHGPWIMPLMVLAGIAGGRALGRDPGFSEDAFSRQRNSRQPDAGLCRVAAAQLSRHRPLEGPERP